MTGFAKKGGPAAAGSTDLAGEALEAAVRSLEALGPWPAGGAAALACSGGADSLFLVHAWLRFAAPRGLCGIALVVDHGHRPGTAEEARRAAELVRGAGLEARVLAVDPVPRASEERLREARYAALGRASAARGAHALLTAHHADDLAETVLLRLLRGTGLRGLAGIPARRAMRAGGWEGEVRRPLLGLRRRVIRDALRDLGQAWIEDPSNRDPRAAARNLLRREVLPRLAGLATGDPVEAVLRLAAEAGEWSECLDALLATGGDWRGLPGYLRRQAVAAELRALGRKVSPARLRDLEGALLTRGSAAVDDAVRLSVAGGRLRAHAR